MTREKKGTFYKDKKISSLGRHNNQMQAANLTELKGEIDKLATIVRSVNTSLFNDR